MEPTLSQTPYLDKLPRRSRVYCLEPIGIGTPMRESLYSYLLRLSERHCVSPHRLCAYLLQPIEFNRTNRLDSFDRLGNKDIAGTTDSAKCLAAVLSQETGICDFDELTMLPFAPCLPITRRGSTYRHWCPACIDENKSRKNNYYPLLWEFALADSCLIHQTALVNSCHVCGIRRNRSQYFFSEIVGHCSGCGHWLGASADTLQASDEFSLMRSKAIHDWISLPHMRGSWSLSNLSKSLRDICRHRFDDNFAAFAKALGVSKSSAHYWLHGEHRPSIDHLTRLSIVSGSSISSLLSNRQVDSSYSQVIPQPMLPRRESKRRRYTRSEVLTALNKLPTQPPPSISQVTRLTGISRNVLYRHAPNETAQILKNYADLKEENRKRKLANVRRTVAKLASERERLSRREFRKYLAKDITKFKWDVTNSLWAEYQEKCDDTKPV